MFFRVWRFENELKRKAIDELFGEVYGEDFLFRRNERTFLLAEKCDIPFSSLKRKKQQIHSDIPRTSKFVKHNSYIVPYNWNSDG